MCYCAVSRQVILKDIESSSVPDEALVRSCCWETVCRVRAWNLEAVDSEVWRDLCAKRGYLFGRQNPRGF
jgi:hypothetical protein